MKSKKRLWLIVAVLLCIITLPGLGFAETHFFKGFGKKNQNTVQESGVETTDEEKTTTEKDSEDAIITTDENPQPVQVGTEDALNSEIASAEDAVEKTIQLTGDINLNATVVIPENKKIVLDLNGCILDASGISEPVNAGESASVIFILGNLKIIDSNENATHPDKKLPDGTELSNGGIITGGIGTKVDGSYATYGGGIYQEETGILTLKGGTIMGNSATFGGGIILYGKLFMEGGGITNNIADTGGGIHCNGEIFLSDGIISQNKAHFNGGGINVSPCRKLTMTGGTVSSNVAESDNRHQGKCGGIAGEVNAEISITGGKIFDNRAFTAGGIGLEETSFTIGGDAQIYDNTIFDEDTDSNLDVNTNSIIISSATPLTDEARIGITNRYNQQAFVSSGAKQGNEECFTSDLPGTVIKTGAQAGTLICSHEEVQTFVVKEKGSTGKGSLRQAVYLAQEGDTITFDDECDMIKLDYELPIVYQSIIIDGKNGVRISQNLVHRIISIDGADDVKFNNLTFENSAGVHSGGAISIQSSKLTAENCIFRNNKATYVYMSSDGGAIYAQDSTLDLKNCLFYGNKTEKGKGGAIAMTDTEAKIINCTIVGNSAEEKGNAIYFLKNNQVRKDITIENTIIVNNTGAQNYEVYMEGIRDASLYRYNVLMTESNWYNCFGGPSGATVKWDNKLDDLFVNTATGCEDYHIKQGSQAYDAGNKDYIGNLTTDLDGKTRVMGANIDLGCYENGYSISKGTIESGSASIKKGGVEVNSSVAGDTISVVTTPKKYYEVEQITVQKIGGESESIEVIDGSFTMPEGDVVVNVTFRQKCPIHRFFKKIGNLFRR